MKATRRMVLGRSGVYVTSLGLGGAALGNLYEQVGEETATATVTTALDLGLGYFDTAPYYGYGLSEQRLGRALAHTDRSNLTISSKVGRLLVARDGAARSDQGFVGANAFDPVFDYTYDGVMRSFEASLERLRSDRIDVILMHDIGAATHGKRHHAELFDVAMDGGYRAMRSLRDRGAVGAIGLGVNESEVCIEALDRADFDCFLLAGRYTLLEQGALSELLPLCQARETSIIIGGPFNSGVLAEPNSSGGHYDYQSVPTAIRERVSRIREICSAHTVPVAAAALQFPLHHPAVASVIPGARTPAEVATNARWMELDIPRALYTDLRDARLIDPAAPIGVAA